MSDADRQARLGARHAVLKARANADQARRKLLAQRRKLARRRRRNRERVERNRERASNRNPSTHSTVPRSDTNAEAAARSSSSTVPERPRYSSIPPRRRLYGSRLHRAAREEEDG